jgi:alkylation response protein AidB-like acyl-CoA dehydrogenase
MNTPVTAAATTSALQRAEQLIDALTADAARSDIDGAFPVQSVDLLRDEGLLRAPLPVQLGGEGLAERGQTLNLLHTLAAIGSGSLVLGRLYEGHVNALQLMAAYGTQQQQRRAADDAGSGHLFGVWNTEELDGLQLSLGDDGLRLAGRKTFASGLGHVSRAIVTAACEPAVPGQPRGWQMLLLNTDEQAPVADTSFWRPLGMRSTASHAADFKGHRVAAHQLIGAPGDYYREPAFSGGAIRFAAVQHGGTTAVFDATRQFLSSLGRTGDPFQRARLAEMAWRVESGRLWLQGAAQQVAMADNAKGSDGGARQVAHAQLMRCAIEDHALQVMALSNRCVGARGLLQPHPFERLQRDLTHYLRQPAPDAALTAAGRFVLEDPRPASELWA